MSKFVLVELADDGTAQATELTDPITVSQPITIPLSALLPEPLA